LWRHFIGFSSADSLYRNLRRFYTDSILFLGRERKDHPMKGRKPTGKAIRTATQLTVAAFAMCLLFILPAADRASSESAAREGQKRPVLFLGNELLPPMTLRENGKPTGVAVDLAYALATYMRRPVEIRLMNWSEAQQSVLDGRADALLHINPSPERTEIYDFSEPLLNTEIAIFCAAERSGVATMKDLRGLRVGVEEKGLPMLLLREDPQIQVKVVPTVVQGFRMLSTGALDAVVADRWVGRYVLAENDIRGVKFFDIPIRQNYSAIAVKKGNADLLAEINAALREIRRDGTYDSIIALWRSKEVVFKTREQWRRQMLLTVSVTVTLILALGGIAVLAREVRRRKRVEATLRESEEQYRLLFASNPNPMFVFDEETLRFLAANDAAVTQYGWSRDEFLSMSVLDIRPPEEREWAQNVIERNRGVREAAVGVVHHCRKDGTIADMETTASPLSFMGRPARLCSMNDVTERGRMEVALRESEERFRLALQNAPVSVAVQDRNLVFQWAYNQRTWRTDEIVGKTDADLFAAEDASWLRELKEGVLESGTETYAERWVTSNGKRVFLDIYLTPMKNPAGEITGVGIATVNLTKQKRAEEAVQTTLQRFYAVLSTMYTGLMLVTDEGVVEFVNQAFCDYFDLTDPPESLVRLPSSEITTRISKTHPNTDEDAARIREMVGQGRPVRGEVISIPGGRELLRDFVPIRVNGKPYGRLWHHMDITDWRRAEADRERLFAELSTERARWQATVENMLDPVTTCDADGRTTYMNRAYAQLIERPIAADLAVEDHPDYYQIYRPDGTPFPAEELPLQKAARTGREVRDVEIIQRSSGGREFIAIFSAAPLRDSEGAITGAVAVGHDITEQRCIERDLKTTLDELEQRVEERTAELHRAYEKLKEETNERGRIEQQLRQAQKMEALGTLSGGVAHDFNNILAAIVGFTELVAGHVAKGSKDEHYLARIMEASIRGRELVRQMLIFSRKTEQEKRPLHLGGVVEETVRLLRPTIPSTITIRVDMGDRSDLVLADPIQMQQVIMNLVTNSVHAMREKGGILDIVLSGDRLPPLDRDPAETHAGPYATLIIRDTGTGIAPDIMDRIFDPFFTTKELGDGTGLGLSVVHGIVKQSGGHLTVESTEGEGSVFTVYLPAIAERRERKGAGEYEIPTGLERILFVDDEESLAEMGEEILSSLGYRVTSSTSSREALQLLKDDPARFDLVITDQTMPDMTGVELAGRILALRPDIPIILCTGFSYVVGAESAKAAGITAFAMKPLTKREIALTIRKVLEG
jgi:PAS domain S-box-containing protein